MRELALVVLISAAMIVGGCAQEEAAGRAAGSAAAAASRRPRRSRRRRRPSRSREPTGRAAGAGARRRDRVGIARRSEPELAAEAGVLRARQQRARRREPEGVLDDNAALLKKYPDAGPSRSKDTATSAGRAEYNLALGERRAVAARAYLVSLGIAADRLRTVSYGKEFPFDPGHDEAAFAKNRRAHFVITAK